MKDTQQWRPFSQLRRSGIYWMRYPGRDLTVIEFTVDRHNPPSFLTFGDWNRVGAEDFIVRQATFLGPLTAPDK